MLFFTSINLLIIVLSKLDKYKKEEIAKETEDKNKREEKEHMIER